VPRYTCRGVSAGVLTRSHLPARTAWLDDRLPVNMSQAPIDYKERKVMQSAYGDVRGGQYGMIKIALIVRLQTTVIDLRVEASSVC